MDDGLEVGLMIGLSIAIIIGTVISAMVHPGFETREFCDSYTGQDSNNKTVTIKKCQVEERMTDPWIGIPALLLMIGGMICVMIWGGFGISIFIDWMRK